MLGVSIQHETNYYKTQAQRDGVPDQQQPPGQIKAEAMASSANAGEINNHLNAVGDFQNNMDAAVASSIAAQTQNAATVAASPLANSQPLADLISSVLIGFSSVFNNN